MPPVVPAGTATSGSELVRRYRGPDSNLGMRAKARETSLTTTEATDTIAAVDLGSNSFHLKVARLRDGELSVLDRLREMVRLAGALDEDDHLVPEATAPALACLERFGQRVRHMPAGSVRVVGTNTLRRAHNAAGFIAAAETALGHPIEIISGVEEARLIYLGVAHSVADDSGRRLVMDIGGGSTELIIGDGLHPVHMESLYIGCVNVSELYFPDGRISRKRLRRAEIATRVEFEPHEARYRRLGWEEAIGASGTIRAVERVVREAGWSNDGITHQALKRLAAALLKAEHVERLRLPGLSADRAPVFPGGVAVLHAAFEALGIERMRLSDGALREGLIYDLIGRIRHEDVRGRTVAALAKRHNVDSEQAMRVEGTALDCLTQVAQDWSLAGDAPEQLLRWAAQLHELGLDIAHNQYHKHGAYILENADLLGFSRQEQRLLAVLVRAHRRKYPVSVFKALPTTWTQTMQRLAVLLRLAVALHRSRTPDPLPPSQLRVETRSLTVRFPKGWLDMHPLTRVDLEQEAVLLKAADFDLRF